MLTRRLLATIAFLLVLAAPARAGAGWAPTGALGEPRGGHEAALLDNGKVLLAGGYSSLRPTEVLGSAELYDPATGTFTAAASMNTPRAQFAMAKLADGRVLAVGGVTGQFGATVIANAEVYDPRLNRWSSVEGLHYARRDPSLVPLPGGKWLIVGGTVFSSGSPSAPVRPTEVFEPGRDTWTLAGDTTSPRDGAVAATLPDGRVVAAGGYDTNVAIASSELFTGSGWIAGNPMNYPHQLAGISLLADGRPFVSSGYGNSPDAYAPTAEIFSGGQWRIAAPPSVGRANHTQTTLTSGRVLITGGQGRQETLSTTELFDPAANAWSSAGAMSSPRNGHTATLLADGRVLVAGGVIATSQAGTISAEVYTAPTSMSVVGTLAFGSRKLGAGSGAALQVTNTGDSPLFVAVAGIGGTNAGDFGANASRCQGVAAGATCTLDVAITPSGPGTREAVLTLSANTTPATVAVNLSGVGVADTDGDGITNDVDRCGRQKGTAVRQGCPAGLLADPSIRYRAGKRSLRVLAYYVKATKGARVTVTCTKKACKKTVTKGKGSKKRIRITRLNGHRLKNGTKITVTVSLRGRLTTTVVDRISKGRRIEGRPRCQPISC